VLEIKNLSAYYGDMQVLFDVSLEVRDGELVTIVGANGAGKSSLLRAVSGLMPKATGDISFDGQPILGHDPHEIVECGWAHTLRTPALTSTSLWSMSTASCLS